MWILDSLLVEDVWKLESWKVRSLESWKVESWKVEKLGGWKVESLKVGG
jgi:hypothetical protein